MRELSKQERSMVAGGMPGPNPPVPARGAPAPMPMPMPMPMSMPQLNLGATLTCEPLATGAGAIGGTAAAIGAAVVTRNPAFVEPAFKAGEFMTTMAADSACHFLMD